jgi:hypothetical protein
MIKLNNLEQFLISNILNESVRIDHAEDLIFWEGSKGAIRSIKSFIELEKNGYKNVTMKWDGSPAVVFGRNDEGKFVLTDKSGFVAKGYNGRPTSPEELEQMFLNRGKSIKTNEYRLFVQNMKEAFSIFESSVPTTFRGYFKGDLLYFNTPLIENGRYVFKPNIVTYTVDINSELGRRIAQSKAAVVVHREVDSFGNESAITNYNIFQGKQLLVIPPISVNNPPDVNEKQLKDILLYISKHARNIDEFLNPSKLTSMKMTNFPDILYKYLNSKVDTGLVNIGQDFLTWVNQSNLTGAMKKKITDYVHSNRDGFDSLWKVVIEIMSVKEEIINQIDNQDTEIKSYIGNQPGGEGYVFSHPEGDIKYVSRSKFSAANRAAHKQPIDEGGWLKPELTSKTVLTPDTIEKATDKFKFFLDDLNKFLTNKQLTPIKDYQVLGSAGYYKQDKEDKKQVTYGDIDVMVVIPIESTDESSDKKKEYIKNVIQFIETSGQNYIDVESANRSDGKQIVIKIDDDNWVQLDLLYTTKVYKDWFAARFTPERGIKGFTMGGMYAALAEVLNIRIGDTGVRAKFKDGKIVSPMLRKDVVDKLISNSPSTFLRDLADFLAGLFGKKITHIDPNLSAHSGVNPNDVKLKDLTTGVLGFAKTLDSNGILIDLGFDYKSFIDAIKNKYAEKMIEQYAKKEKKATTPETQYSIDKIKKHADLGNKIVNDILKELLITEGGNAVAANSYLPKEYLDSTIKNGLKLWNLDVLKYEIIGNKEKPILGDIDIAISIEQLEKLLGADYEYDKKTFYEKLQNYVESNKPDVPTPSFKIISGLDQLHLNVPIVDQDGNTVRSTEIPNEDGYIQIDLMIGDLNFMIKALSSAPDSKYKAALRNILLMNIMSNSYEPTDDPNKQKRYQFNWKKGLQSADVIKNEKGKQEKQNIKTVYTDMDDVAKFLFGNNVTFNDINTLEKLIKLVKGNTFRYKNKKTEILNDFKKELEKLKIEL